MSKLHELQMEMEAVSLNILTEGKVSRLSELVASSLAKSKKDILADIIVNLVQVFEKNMNLCKIAAEKIDDLKTEQIDQQKKLLALQNSKMNSMQTAVTSELKQEIKSWSDIVKKNNSKMQSDQLSITKKSVQQVIRNVNEEERRSKNLMIHGLKESDNDDINETLQSVREVFESMNLPDPDTIDCYRVGRKETGRTRPVRLEYKNSGDVDFALSHSSKLKNSSKYSTVYLSPDRTKEQQLAHKAFIKKMKELISLDSGKHYYIKNNKVLSADK